jgi:ribonucleoside-diphosphate reductase alpha chain
MDGYLNIMAVIQKFFDQSISTNTSYNPQHYENSEVPASVLIGDLLRSYKLGIKTLYYQNTYDGKGEEEITDKQLDDEVADLLSMTDDCESCKL